MNMEELLLGYIEDDLSPDQRVTVEALLATQAGLRQQLAELQKLQQLIQESPKLSPSAASKSNFQEWLDQTEVQPTLRVRFKKWIQPWMVAASLLLLVAAVFLIQNQRQMNALQAELQQQQQLMFALLTNESVSGRVQAVHLAMKQPKADEDLLKTLKKVLNTDKNSTVQLTAIDALCQFSEQAEARQIMLETLDTEQKPIIKIALIQALIQLEERAVIPELQKLINHPMSEKPVKDEAYHGLIRLGEPI